MPIGYATAKINITSFVVDGIDSDDLPDDMPLTAKMTLTPMIQAGRTLSYNDSGETKLKAVLPITVDIGADGSIDHQGRDYVKLVAPTAGETNLARLQWRATFSNIRLGGVATTVVIDPIYFWVDPGVPVNIADNVNVAASTAVSIARGARGPGIVGAFTNEDGDLVLQLESESGPIDLEPLVLPAPTVEDGAITEAKLDPAVVAEIDAKAPLTALAAKADTATVNSALEGKAPANDIPKTMLALDVREALDTAADALTITDANATYVRFAQLARTPEVLITGTITRNTDGAATSAPVTWPDGTPGTYTALTVSTAFPGAVDSYKITYGSPVTQTFTQPAVTRNADGAATAVPAIVVS